jgi:hypothetical protein
LIGRYRKATNYDLCIYEDIMLTRRVLNFCCSSLILLYVNNMKVESAAGLPGDFNNDGKVDGIDLLVWQRNTSVGALADWKSNYGTGGLAAISAVPEPTVLCLCSLALAASLVSRRPRGH